ncbi:MAG: FAD-dependent oxidoreductase [Bacteriovoracales bacterium]
MNDLIIIGNGIAANCFLWELQKQKRNLSILKIHSEDLAPSCSLNSTAMVTLRGITKGISPLGDELFDAYQLAESFFKAEKPDGVVPSKFYSICEEEEKEEYLRRFGSLEEIEFSTLKDKYSGKIWDGFIINPEKFLTFLQRNTNDSHTSISAMVTTTDFTEEGVTVSTLDGAKYRAQKLLICAGAYTKIYEPLYPVHDAIKGSQSVPGAYLEIGSVDLGPKSFVVSRGGENLIYWAETKTLKIGTTTQKNGIEAADFAKLKEIYENFQEIIKEELPKISDFKVKVGLRQKGPKRKPFYGKVAPNVFALISLYKNGYTFPFLGAKKILNLMD